MKSREPIAREAAEELAIQALTFIAGDALQLGRFLAITGIGPEQIRAAAREPGFLAGVLDHIASDEKLLTAFTAESGFAPDDIGKAQAALGGRPWEREVP